MEKNYQSVSLRNINGHFTGWLWILEENGLKNDQEKGKKGKSEEEEKLKEGENMMIMIMNRSKY